MKPGDEDPYLNDRPLHLCCHYTDQDQDMFKSHSDFRPHATEEECAKSFPESAAKLLRNFSTFTSGNLTEVVLVFVDGHFEICNGRHRCGMMEMLVSSGCRFFLHNSWPNTVAGLHQLSYRFTVLCDAKGNHENVTKYQAGCWAVRMTEKETSVVPREPLALNYNFYANLSLDFLNAATFAIKAKEGKKKDMPTTLGGVKFARVDRKRGVLFKSAADSVYVFPGDEKPWLDKESANLPKGLTLLGSAKESKLDSLEAFFQIMLRALMNSKDVQPPATLGDIDCHLLSSVCHVMQETFVGAGFDPSELSFSKLWGSFVSAFPLGLRTNLKVADLREDLRLLLQRFLALPPKASKQNKTARGNNLVLNYLLSLHLNASHPQLRVLLQQRYLFPVPLLTSSASPLWCLLCGSSPESRSYMSDLQKFLLSAKRIDDIAKDAADLPAQTLDLKLQLGFTAWFKRLSDALQNDYLSFFPDCKKAVEAFASPFLVDRNTKEGDAVGEEAQEEDEPELIKFSEVELLQLALAGAKKPAEKKKFFEQIQLRKTQEQKEQELAEKTRKEKEAAEAKADAERKAAEAKALAEKDMPVRLITSSFPENESHAAIFSVQQGDGENEVLTALVKVQGLSVVIWHPAPEGPSEVDSLAFQNLLRGHPLATRPLLLGILVSAPASKNALSTIMKASEEALVTGNILAVAAFSEIAPSTTVQFARVSGASKMSAALWFNFSLYEISCEERRLAVEEIPSESELEQCLTSTINMAKAPSVPIVLSSLVSFFSPARWHNGIILRGFLGVIAPCLTFLHDQEEENDPDSIVVQLQPSSGWHLWLGGPHSTFSMPAAWLPEDPTRLSLMSAHGPASTPTAEGPAPHPVASAQTPVRTKSAKKPAAKGKKKQKKASSQGSSQGSKRSRADEEQLDEEQLEDKGQKEEEEEEEDQEDLEEETPKKGAAKKPKQAEPKTPKSAPKKGNSRRKN